MDYTDCECIITRELSSKVLSVIYVMSRHLSHDDHNFSSVRRIFFHSRVVVAELKRKNSVRIESIASVLVFGTSVVVYGNHLLSPLNTKSENSPSDAHKLSSKR